MINHQSLDITLYKSFPMGKMKVVSLRFIFGEGIPESPESFSLMFSYD